MFIGRDSELKTLNEYRERGGNQILVLYGKAGIGKTTLLKQFMEQTKDTFYLECLALSEREQLFQWTSILAKQHPDIPAYSTYQDIFSCALGKKVLIFDEFQHLLKNSVSFIDTLFSFLLSSEQDYFVILCSSSLEWIENSMIHRIGAKAKLLSGFLKLRDLTFQDFMKYFKNFTFEECIEGYAILGGVPYLWEQFSQNKSLKDNIVETILSPQSVLFDYGEQFVARQLRETAVYNSILCALASGVKKLNDLYLHTGFSRAKISVYLKNLMELGIVYKEFSYDTDGRENVQKGIYGIADHYVDFTYQFLFPYKQERREMNRADFYETRILPYRKEYTARYFAVIFKEYMELQNQTGRLPISCNKMGKWIGKAGTIDFIGQNEEQKTILGLCNWERPMMRYDDYEWLLFCAKQAKLQADYVYLFSAEGFDEKLRFAAASRQNIYLLTLTDL